MLSFVQLDRNSMVYTVTEFISSSLDPKGQKGIVTLLSCWYSYRFSSELLLNKNPGWGGGGGGGGAKTPH